MKNYTLSVVLLLAIAQLNISFNINRSDLPKHTALPQKTYYFSPAGNDKNLGTKVSPWQTISKLNSLQFHPGDSVLFEGGKTFAGTIILDTLDSGNLTGPVFIGSYGSGLAIINGGNASAITISHGRYLSLKNLKLTGSGRKTGNVKEGISLLSSKYIALSYLDISGFQKAGLFVTSSANITIAHVYAHDNGAAGIAVEGTYARKDCRDIYIGYCRAANNAGDPTNLGNHSGSGIIVGECRKVTIEYCEATNNGWDMPRTGNGPVGIWGYETDSLIIQNCLSYRNKTSPGGQDGGGFDLDGGISNSIIQYCLSYENQGAGYGIFQYYGASPWYNNVLRYNISVDDGLVSGARAGVFIWNGSGSESQFRNCIFHNNTIQNTKAAAISYSDNSKRKNFSFFNNIFTSKDSLIRGKRGIDSFFANNWWSITKGFNIERIYDFTAWAKLSGQEIIKGKISGFNIDPGFKAFADSMPQSASNLRAFSRYYLPEASPLLNGGLDLKLMFGIQTGGFDFNRQPALLKGIGACSKTFVRLPVYVFNSD